MFWPRSGKQLRLLRTWQTNIFVLIMKKSNKKLSMMTSAQCSTCNLFMVGEIEAFVVLGGSKGA
jgi:hypothetical protein